MIKSKLALLVLAGAASTAAFASNDKPASSYKNDTVVASLSPTGGKQRTHSFVEGSGAGSTENRGDIEGSLKSAPNPAQPGDAAAPAEIANPMARNSNDTCMGSKSTGLQLPVVGGISLGSSWVDQNCMMIKNARELWNMGYKSAALARMCMDDRNREALESTGTPCPPKRTASASRRTEPHDSTQMQ